MSRLRQIVPLFFAASIMTACGGEKTVAPQPSISLNVDPATASAPQGGEVTGALTLTRIEDFSGPVDFTVTGAPAGVTATVIDVSDPTSEATTATLNVDVDPATAPGVYALVVHGTSDGVGETTATFTLTVTPPAP